MNSKKKNDKSLKIRYLIVVLILTVAYLCFDYFNIPKQLGITISNLNMDILGIVINSVVVITLYIISFFAIEKRQLQKQIEEEKRLLIKENNIKNTSSMLIKYTCIDCLELLKILDNEEMLFDYIIPKIDFNAPIVEDKITCDLSNKPFQSYEQIMQFAKDGYLSEKEFQDYLEIKRLYGQVISEKTTFFDVDSLEEKTDRQKAISQSMKENEATLKMMLNWYI